MDGVKATTLAGRWASVSRAVRIRAAKALVAGFGYDLAHREHLDDLERKSARLREYVTISGGLADPRRIRARQVIMDNTSDIALKARLARVVA